MAGSDLEIVAGTTFAFSVAWQQKDGAQLSAVDITGCSVRFQVRDAKSDELLIDAGTDGRGVEIPVGTDGVINVSISPGVTRAIKPRALGAAVYELRVYFPSGEVYPVLPPGLAVITQGVIRD